MERDIKVVYDGEYPTACMGCLKVWVDQELVYSEEFCCSSTGKVWFDDDWDAHVEHGELLWNDAEAFDKDIQEAVKAELDKVSVCCGGCI